MTDFRSFIILARRRDIAVTDEKPVQKKKSTRESVARPRHREGGGYKLRMNNKKLNSGITRIKIK